MILSKGDYYILVVSLFAYISMGIIEPPTKGIIMLMTIENMKDELLELNRLREEATDPARKQELSHTIRIMTQKLNQRYSIMTASVPHVNRIY